jgi:hypothetical protein
MYIPSEANPMTITSQAKRAAPPWLRLKMYDMPWMVLASLYSVTVSITAQLFDFFFLFLLPSEAENDDPIFTDPMFFSNAF